MQVMRSDYSHTHPLLSPFYSGQICLLPVKSFLTFLSFCLFLIEHNFSFGDFYGLLSISPLTLLSVASFQIFNYYCYRHKPTCPVLHWFHVALLICTCVLDWLLGIWLGISLSSHHLPATSNLRVGPCEISLIHFGMPTDVIMQV